LIKSLIRKLPGPAEFCLVVGICAWSGIYSSIFSIAHRSWNADIQPPKYYTGIGIELGAKDHKVIITNVLPGTPAAGAGLSRGWIIQKIDGASTEGKTPIDCSRMASGPVGSTVKLELVNAALNQTNTVAVTRGTIPDLSSRHHITDQSVLVLMLIEIFGLAVTFWIARARGWQLAAWGFGPSWKYTGAGILLCLISWLAIHGLAKGVDTLLPGLILQRHPVIQVSLVVLIPFAMVNGVFEEVLESGYFIQSLQRYGAWAAILASAAFRAFLHAYQGINAVIIIFPFGLLFGFVYWKWRRLWPLFVAHFLFDVYAFYPK
jgi:membrane protease YdiL (CAAX protease family)